MMPVESWHDPHDSAHVEDHYGLAQIPRNAKTECMLTVGDHSVIRNLYTHFHRALVRSAISCQKVIKGKRRSLRSLVIRNYVPPKHPLYTAVAGPILTWICSGCDNKHGIDG
jgi:hypothetical protein